MHETIFTMLTVFPIVGFIVGAILDYLRLQPLTKNESPIPLRKRLGSMAISGIINAIAFTIIGFFALWMLPDASTSRIYGLSITSGIVGGLCGTLSIRRSRKRAMAQYANTHGDTGL